MPRLTFVVGKGGVGKTTVASAYALHQAATHPREPVLLMSTDPAHSLGDILQIKLGHTPRRSSATGKLSLWQVDSQREFNKFLDENREAVLSIVEQGTLFSKEEIAPLLDTSLPGMSEVAALLAIQDLLEHGRYAHIVVDTAPMGHTLRLFELPDHFQRFLDFLEVASSRDALLARRFGGRKVFRSQPFLDHWQSAVDQVKSAFTSSNAELFLVTSPETFSLNEAVRSIHSLQKSLPEMRPAKIILNRMVDQAGHCRRCMQRQRVAQKAKRFLKQHFAGVPLLVGPDPGNPLLGAAILRRFGRAVFEEGKRNSKLAQAPPKRPRAIAFAKTKWPDVNTRLTVTVGKGGVGKTTVTAALAFHSRQQVPSVPVTVCSTDPAPSLDDVFQQAVGGKSAPVLGDPEFQAMELDSVAEFRHWAQRVREQLQSATSVESGGLHVDLSFEKQVFASLMDVVPPGVDELFAIFSILELIEHGQGKVLIDMAPTGHALELLRMPERVLQWSRLLLKSLAAHRTLALAQDVAVELATLGQRVRKLLEIMRDPKRCQASVVMLAEPVPDRQTARLLAAVQDLGIGTGPLVVNRVLMDDQRNCARCRRARDWQMFVLAGFKRRYAKYRTLIVPDFAAEIAGRTALQKFTTEIWQIAK